MLCFGVGERAEGTGGKQVGAQGEGVATFPAVGALRGLGGGEHLFYPLVAGEDVNQGEEYLSVGRGHCDNHRGGGPLTS